MRKVTIRVPEQQLEMLRALVELGDFPTISEAIRAGVRDMAYKAKENNGWKGGTRTMKKVP